jgi:hypothetical protein
MSSKHAVRLESNVLETHARVARRKNKNFQCKQISKFLRPLIGCRSRLDCLSRAITKEKELAFNE